MSLYLPPEMRWLGWIAGAEWPDGDEDNAWAVSDVWKEAAAELLALIAAVDEAKAATMAAYSDGAARAEMGALYDQMRSGESSIEALAKYMQQTSDSTFDMGTELQAEKITIIVTLCWLAIEIALAWLFPPTAPAVEAAAVGTSRAILQSVRTATQKAIQQLAAKLGAPTVKRSFWRSLLAGKPALPTAKGWGVVGSEVIQGAAEEALISGAVQAGQVADDKRREMDWSEIGYSAAAGGFAEPIGGAVAKGLNKGFAGGFGFNKNLGGQLDNWWGRAGQNTVVGAVSDGLAGIAGSLFVAGISGQSVSDTLTGVGVAGGFIQGGIVGLADPSTFGRSGFAGSAAGDGGAGGGNLFGRSGGEGGFDNGSGDGSGTGDQVGQSPPPGSGTPGDGDSPRTRGGNSERAGESEAQRPGGSRGGPADSPESSRAGPPGFTQPQSFAGAEQVPADGPQVSNRWPGSGFAGSDSDSTGTGPFSSPGDTSSGLTPSGGQSPPSEPDTGGGPSHASEALAGNGAAPGALRNSSAGPQGDTASLPGAGDESGAAGASGGAGSASGGGGVADGDGHGGSAGGEGGVGGSNGAGGTAGESPSAGVGTQAGESASVAGEQAPDTTTDQDFHQNQPGGPGGPEGHDQPGTGAQQSDEPGSRPGATATPGDTGDRVGGASVPAAQSFQAGGPPVPGASGPAPTSGAIQNPGAGQTPAVTQNPGPASAAGGPPPNSRPTQVAGPGQSSGPAPSGRTETPTGQSSPAVRPGITTGLFDPAAGAPEVQGNRPITESGTTPPASTGVPGRPEYPMSDSPDTDSDIEWADLVGGDLPDDLESRWTPQAFEAMISMNAAGITASPTGLGAGSTGSVPAGPGSLPGTPAPATTTQLGPHPSPPAQTPNSPGSPAPNSSSPHTPNPVSGSAQPGTTSPNQPQAGSGQPQAGPAQSHSGPAQLPAGTAQPQAGPAQSQPGPNQSGAQSAAEGDPGRPKRGHSETGPSPEPPLKRARAGEPAPGSPQPDGSETGSEDAQPVPVFVPVDNRPQHQSPAPQSPRTPRPPRDSEAELSADEESDWEGWTDPESEADTAPEPPLFGRPEPPMVLGNPRQSRVYGPGLLAPLEDPQLQQDLEGALRGADGNFVRYADPRTHPAGGTPYGRLINPGMSGSASRGNNCAEAALAGLASFYGVPMVAAPRFPDVVNGVIDRRGGERGSPQRVFQMLRTGQESYEDGRPVPEQYTAMDNWVRHLGPGSAAYVTSMWKQIDPATGRPFPDDGSVIFEAHTTLIVYPEGAEGPVWWDPQSGEMTLGPSPDMVDRSAGVAFIPIPGNRVIAADPDPAAGPAAPVPYQPPAGPVVVPAAQSADRSPLQLPDPATSRTFGPGNSNPDLHPGLQQVLESALRDGSGGFVTGAHPGTHPSAAAPYGLLVNGGGPDVPGRRSNNFDAALSALSSFLGTPRVAAARYPDSAAGPGDRAAEADSARRAARWAGGNLHRFPAEQPMTQQFANLHTWVHHLGPGSAALVFSAVPERDPATGSILRDPQGEPVIRVHPTVVVYPPAASGPVWWNAVTGETWDHPPADLVAITGRLRFIPIPAGSTVVESAPLPAGSAAQPPPQDSADGRDPQGIPDPTGPPYHLRERTRRFLERSGRPTSTGTPPHAASPAIEYTPIPEVVQAPESATQPIAAQPSPAEAVPSGTEAFVPERELAELPQTQTLPSERELSSREPAPAPAGAPVPDLTAAAELPASEVVPDGRTATHPGTLPVSAQTGPVRSPELDEGYIGADGYRQFSSDEAGDRYGENHLGGEFRRLSPEQQTAVRKYVAESFTVNNVLRDGAPDREPFFARVRASAPALATLYELTGGALPTRADLERIRQNPELTPGQRTAVDTALAEPDLDSYVEQLTADQDTLSRLTAYLGTEPSQAAFDQRITDLNAALERPIPGGPVRAVRGVNDLSFMVTADDTPLGGRDPRLLAGTTQQEPAYLSTSLGVVPAFPGVVRIELDLPEGAHGLWLGRNGRYGYERELLLPRGTRYRITEVVADPAGDYGNIRPKYLIRATVLPPESAAGLSSGDQRADSRRPPIAGDRPADPPVDEDSDGLIPVRSQTAESSGLIPVVSRGPVEPESSGPVPAGSTATEEGSTGLIPAELSRPEPSRQYVQDPEHELPGEDWRYRPPANRLPHELSAGNERYELSGGDSRHELPGSELRHELPGDGLRHELPAGEQRQELPGPESVTDESPPDGNRGGGDRPPTPAELGPRSGEPDDTPVEAPPADAPATKRPRLEEPTTDSSAPESGPAESTSAETSTEEPDPAERPPGSQQDIVPRPRLDRPWPPLVLSNGTDARAYGPGWLAPLEDPAAQTRLENTMRDTGGDFVRYADPRSFPANATPWGELINPGGTAAPGRNKNCLECALTGLMTFLGRPQVALPRFTRIVDGVADSGGSDGLDQTRLYEMLGNQPNDFDDGTRTITEQFLAIHEYIKNLGPGSAAYVPFHWQPIDPRTGRGMHRNGRPVLSGHATLVVYPVGAKGPVWWDPQGNIATDKPSLRLVHSTRWVGFVPVPPGRSVQESFASAGPMRPQPAALVPVPVPDAVLAPEHDRPEPPQRLPDPAAGRRVGPGELRAVEHPGFQKALENALRADDGSFVVGADPHTYPRPERPYGKLVNPGGGALKGRGTNRFDAALSGLATFLGKPEVAAPRQTDPAAPGNDRADERNGPARAVQWLGSEPTGFDTSLPMDEQYTALHKWVGFLGPGSAALVLSTKPEVDPRTGGPVRTPDGETVAGEPEPSLVVYPRNGSGPVWWDPLTGKTSVAPPQSLVGETTALTFVSIPPGRTIGPVSSATADPFSTDNSAGVTDGAAATDRGPGAHAPAGGAPGRQPVPDRPDAGGRLAAPTGADPGGGGDGRGDRDVVPGGERGHGSDPGVSELGGFDGDGRLHRSGDERPETVGPADLSSADPDRTTPDGGESGSDRIPRRRPLGAETTRAVLDGDRQENAATAADDQRRDGGRGLGGVAAGTGRGVAGDGSDGVLNPAGPPPTTAQYTPEQLALIPQPAHDRNPARWGRPETAAYQADLEAAVGDGKGGFVQFAHPATTAVPGGKPLIELINGPGPSARGRDDNCEDCVLSLLATFLGKPQVAAPAIGPHERDMGNRGQARAERLLGSQLVRYADGHRTIEEQYRLAHDRIAALGPGSMAFVVAVWHERDNNGDKVYDKRGEPRFAGSHSFAVVFPAGADGPVWCDPQVGRTADAPIARYVRDTALVGFVISTPQRVLAAAETRTNLESALSDGNGGFVKYADPRLYRKLVTDNHFGTEGRISMYRAGIAGTATFLGCPRFAPPAWNDIEADGGPRTLHRLHEEGRTEVEHFFQKSMRTLDDGRRTITRQLDLIYQRVLDLGPESVALVEVTHRRGADVVADECLLLVYPAGPSSAPVWWNPAKGATYRHASVTMLLDEPATDSILYVTAAAGDLVAGNLAALLAAPAQYGFSGTVGTDPQTWAADASSSGSADTADTSQAHPATGPVSNRLLAPAQSIAISESALERVSGRWGELENFQYQLDLETAISDDDDNFVAFRHPGDASVPGGYPYIELINGPGMAAPGRNENCEDCVAALLSTFLGKPQVALPAIGPPGRDRGSHGIMKAERLLGSQVMSFGWEGQPIAEQYRAAHDRIAELGPGTMADVSIQWQDTDEQGRKRYNPDGTPARGDQHAMAVVFPEGAAGPVWCDPQSGRTYDFPTPTMIDATLGVAFVISTPERAVQAAEHRAQLAAALDDGAGGFAAFRHPGSYKQLIAYNRFDPARCQHSIYRVGVAAAATFLGRPRFAPPSWNDLNTGGRPSVPQVLDTGGRRDVEEFFQGPLRSLQPADAPMAEQLGFLHQLIQQPQFGTGSVVFVELTHRYQLPGIGSHEVADQCLLLVYPEAGPQPAEPVWWDPLVGSVYQHDALIATVAIDAVGMMFAAATSDTLINGNFTPTPSGSAGSSPHGPPVSRSAARTGGIAHPPPALPEAPVAEAIDGQERPVDTRSPRYRGHGRIQRRRPIEWVLPTGFRAPGAPQSWLPAGSVPAGTGHEHGSSADEPGAGELPEVDIPFTLGMDPGAE
ncbi:toxin glutamine deamidase domain-containing protein [Nocardia carnea]|uniref:toxin glutamine deamidase domain-containing protein n=1 Tax=Nocardia carnea TaxID=37328 RepID=UPI0024541E19|nr:toxin glutamine deamidase domain-containing protein [Nocardia carnea]